MIRVETPEPAERGEDASEGKVTKLGLLQAAGAKRLVELAERIEGDEPTYTEALPILRESNGITQLEVREAKQGRVRTLPPAPRKP